MMPCGRHCPKDRVWKKMWCKKQRPYDGAATISSERKRKMKSDSAYAKTEREGRR